MRIDLRLVFVIVFSMALGAAGAMTWLFIPADYGSAVVWNAAGASAFAVAGWVATLSLFARRVDHENPSELIWLAMGSASMSLLAAGFLWLTSDTWNTDGWDFKALMGTALVLTIAMLPFRFRAITRKYANKRKAQSA